MFTVYLNAKSYHTLNRLSVTLIFTIFSLNKYIEERNFVYFWCTIWQKPIYFVLCVIHRSTEISVDWWHRLDVLDQSLFRDLIQFFGSLVDWEEFFFWKVRNDVYEKGTVLRNTRYSTWFLKLFFCNQLCLIYFGVSEMFTVKWLLKSWLKLTDNAHLNNATPERIWNIMLSQRHFDNILLNWIKWIGRIKHQSY